MAENSIEVVDAKDTKNRHYALVKATSETNKAVVYYGYYYDYWRRECVEIIRRLIHPEMDTKYYRENVTHIFNIRVSNVEKGLR